MRGVRQRLVIQLNGRALEHYFQSLCFNLQVLGGGVCVCLYRAKKPRGRVVSGTSAVTLQIMLSRLLALPLPFLLHLSFSPPVALPTPQVTTSCAHHATTGLILDSMVFPFRPWTIASLLGFILMTLPYIIPAPSPVEKGQPTSPNGFLRSQQLNFTPMSQT